jgi:hypothetical protein
MRPDAVGLGGFDSHTLPPLCFLNPTWLLVVALQS